jgi:exosome complex RNA-binding protein Csl4
LRRNRRFSSITEVGNRMLRLSMHNHRSKLCINWQTKINCKIITDVGPDSRQTTNKVQITMVEGRDSSRVRKHKTMVKDIRTTSMVISSEVIRVVVRGTSRQGIITRVRIMAMARKGMINMTISKQDMGVVKEVASNLRGKTSRFKMNTFNQLKKYGKLRMYHIWII